MILPLEQQVCTLESAKLLKELGVKQESLFNWTFDNGYSVTQSKVSLFDQPIYSAYNVAEFGEMLPLTIIYDNYFTHLIFRKDPLGFYIEYVPYADRKALVIIDKNEAEARAKMLIYLIQEGLLKL